MSQGMSEAQFINAYHSAALWFVAMYMEAFLLRMDELEDTAKKDGLIKEIYAKGGNADKDENGTRARVNALWRIIKSGRVIQVLEIASTSDKLKNEFSEACETAKDLLKRIKNGDFVIPNIPLYSDTL
ncbi:MAG: hypothetical protein EOM52_00795 [Clostridia bacterium]|nr:hypothetical protein [Clostridia bacterium]